MKKCDTCIYRNENEYHKPCIVYRDDCEFYEKERGDMTDDLINRQAVLDAMYALCDKNVTLQDNPYRDNPHIDAIIDVINGLPSVTPTEQTSRWTISDAKWGSVIACNHCGRVFPTMEPYCGNCGRRMLKPIGKECEA